MSNNFEDRTDTNEATNLIDQQNPPSETAAAAAATPDQAFRAGLSQKLRTPLNAIIGFTELLALQPGAKRREGDVQQILKSARELLEIIEIELGEPSTEPTKGGRAGSTAPARVCDVLYVEDDIVNFTLVERILEYRPAVSVMHAPEGQLGCELAEAYQPRLILLDLNLPDMHGSEVLRRLQANAATSGIPTVVLSADATPSQIERLLTAGAKNYLTKPFDIEQFLAVVDEYLAAAAK
jgi:CheY-like chemotaxis protein